MTSLEMIGLGVLIVASAFISIYAQYRITQIGASAVSSRVEELNLALGEAIQMVQSGTQQMENPLVAIISKVLDQQIDPGVTAKVIEKDESGKFVKKIE